MDDSTTIPVTWKELIRREPRLADLAFRIAQLRYPRPPRFCARAVWHGHDGYVPGLRWIVSHLVGWQAVRQDDPILRSAAAYDLAWPKLYALLPNCRNCDCGTREEILTHVHIAKRLDAPMPEALDTDEEGSWEIVRLSDVE